MIRGARLPSRRWAPLWLGMAACLWLRTARAETPWVDDSQVLGARRVLLSLGYGQAFSRTVMAGETRPLYAGGRGLNLEETLGVGNQLELGARFGFRLERKARGVRADAAARGFDTETYGTGLSVAANPELRVRWRLLLRRWLEAGVEDRAVLPTPPDPSFTEVAGCWLVLRRRSVARLDLALNAVLTWDSFAAGSAIKPGLGMPVRAWLNLTPSVVVGTLFAVHAFGKTRYEPSSSRLIVGMLAGYRWREWDFNAVLEAQDVAQGLLRRAGYGLVLSWHP